MTDRNGRDIPVAEVRPRLPVGPIFERFTEQDVTDAALEYVLQVAHLAPSEWNFQPWRWIVVRDPCARQQLEAASYIKVPLSSAPVVLVCLADTMAWKSAPLHLREMIAHRKITEGEAHETLHMLREYYSASPEVAKRAARATSFVALHQMLLAAVERGLSGYWITEFDEPRIKTYCHIPDHFVVAALLPLGFREAAPPPSLPRLPLQALVYREKYGEALDSTR